MERKMWFKIIVFCISITVVLTADEHRPKTKSNKDNNDDDRSKRGLEYSLGHGGFIQTQNQRSERRISTLPIATQARYPSFFPSVTNRQFSANPIRKYPPPPYAVSMEPLIHYSQRDPLFDPTTLQLLPQPHNDLLANKHDDLITDSNHLADQIYGPPTKQYIERPVYIKEPEPIIEIIIKEANTTPVHHPPQPILVPKKKKEEVQVFYVKYKKNPHGTGKDSVIYDKPIPAITPVKDGHRGHDTAEDDDSGYELQHPQEHITYAPPIPTTIRAIIKPDSETYHADHGIHVTFNSEHNDHEAGYSSHNEQLAHSARSTSSDDVNEESAPHVAVSHPHQERELHPQVNVDNFQKRQQHISFNGPPSSSFRQPQPYRPFNQPPPNFQPDFSQQQSQFQPSKRLPPLQINSPFQSGPFAEPPRQPVPYQPFEQIRNTPPTPFQFPKPQSHFPVTHPQVPSVNPPVVFNPQRQNGFSIIGQQIFNGPPKVVKPQNLNQQQVGLQNQHFGQQHKFQLQQTVQNVQNQQQNPFQNVKNNHNQFNIQIPQNQHHQQNENFQYFKQPVEVNQQHFQQSSEQIQHPNHNYQTIQQPNQNFQQNVQQTNNYQHFQNLQQQHQNILPAGGELIHSLPKFEQHISVPAAPIHLLVNQQQREVNYNNQQQNQGNQQSDTQENQNHHQQQQQQQQQQTVNQQQFNNAQQHNEQNNNHGQPLNSEEYNKQVLNQFRQFYDHNQAQALKQTQTQAANNLYNLQQNTFTNLNQPNNFGVKSTTYTPPISKQSTFKSSHPITRNYFTPQTTPFSTPKRVTYNTISSTTTTTTTPKPESTTLDLKALNIQLPDEVPDDLRQQLLASGILKNADISILDYDKVGDIPLSALPPDQLANFYQAGGGQQIAAGSHVKEQVLKLDGSSLTAEELKGLDQTPEGSTNNEIVRQPTLKVVHYNPSLEQDLKSSYVQDGATQVEPVILNDNTYNRYLPLKVSGTQFPIPDVPQLKGKNINSVVVLAPIDYNFQDNQRPTREAKKGNIKFLKNESLKRLLKNPTKENYKEWLRRENNTSSEKQSVILLVTGPTNQKVNREIFMYDVATQTVSKLNGELSSAFVDAAETNTAEEEIQDLPQSSNRVETRVPVPPHMSLITKRQDEIEDEALVDDLTPAGSEYVDVRVPIIDPLDEDLEAEGSEQLEKFVDISGEELTASASNEMKKQDENVYINAGYSKTGFN